MLKYIVLFMLAGEIPLTAGDKPGLPDAVSRESYIRHLEYLGDDLFEGRGTGQRGGTLAAKYLAYEFDKLNLVPIGDNNTYYQYIPMHGSFPLEKSDLSLYSKSDTAKFELWEDYILFKSGEQTFIPKPLELVFAGYGITAPEYDYNDYNIDVSGKIVVVLDGEPLSSDSTFFEGEKRTVYSYPETKQRVALSRGAAGTIVIPNPDEDFRSSWDKLKQSFSFEHITLAYNPAGHLSLFINPKKADELLAGTGKTLDDLYDLHAGSLLTSFPLNVRMSFYGYFRERDFHAANIIGMIRGVDKKLKDSYIILSAHYDHLGIGPAVKGDSIYNGVLDNAMGAAGLIEIAAAFKKADAPPARSIIFLLTTGEEHGLLGAKYYTQHPVVPLYKTVANINIDGVAFIDSFNAVTGIGTVFSSLDALLQHAAAECALSVADIPDAFIQGESFEFSDQIAFAVEGVPACLISDAVDYKTITKQEGIRKLIDYSQYIYHSPFDDLNAGINYDAALQHLNFIYYFCRNISSADAIIEWNDGVKFKNARLRSKAERR